MPIPVSLIANATRLKQSHEDVTRVAQSLEIKVQERTRELEASKLAAEAAKQYTRRAGGEVGELTLLLRENAFP